MGAGHDSRLGKDSMMTDRKFEYNTTKTIEADCWLCKWKSTAIDAKCGTNIRTYKNTKCGNRNYLERKS